MMNEDEVRYEWTQAVECLNAAKYLIDHRDELENDVYVVPTEVDQRIAAYKLEAMGIEIDTLTEEQAEYLNSWQHGT